ncbi:MAG: cytidine deaminase [Gammaproteobacteria bacterium]
MEQLKRLARNASSRAYSPYSGIRVGAAVYAEDGKCYTGCNIENASYGLTLCAERVAMAAAVAAGATRITAIAVALHPEGEQVEKFSPCGACLQFLAEFADGETIIAVEGTEFALSDLFSSPFVVS